MHQQPSPETEIELAWQKASPIAGRDPSRYRLAPDILRTVIRRDRYNICGKYGWRIEHGQPVTYHRISIASAMRRLERDLARGIGTGGPAHSLR